MDQESEIELLTRFIWRYAAYEDQLSNDRWSADSTAYTRLFRQYDPVDKELNTILANTAPYYNIFSILNVRQYETKLHTPFLRHLLDPYESHQQGILFLHDFLTRFAGLQESEGTISGITVYEELAAEEGRMDILIEYRQGDKNKIVVIENKIYAGDQPGQLERYHKYITKGRGYRQGDFRILYLKPYRSQPSEISISKLLYHQLLNARSLVCIGYNEDVIPWLAGLLPAIKPLQLHNIIQQYIITIKTL